MMKRRFAWTVRALVLAIAASASMLLAGCKAQEADVSTGPEAGGGKLHVTIATAASSSAAKPRPKLRPGAKTVALARAGDSPYDKTFDDIRFNMTPGEKFQRSMLTKEIEALNGQRIRIRGYILPTPQKHGIQQFVLVRDNQECCFGPGAALYDCILVEMKPGIMADFTIRPIAVEGTFNLREFVVDGKYLAIYQMDGESAR